MLVAHVYICVGASRNVWVQLNTSLQPLHGAFAPSVRRPDLPAHLLDDGQQFTVGGALGHFDRLFERFHQCFMFQNKQEKDPSRQSLEKLTSECAEPVK